MEVTTSGDMLVELVQVPTQEMIQSTQPNTLQALATMQPAIVQPGTTMEAGDP